ncbi:MAG TPA: hypothetical protein VF508_06990 [Pyrinomonadaceae bacterium]
MGAAVEQEIRVKIKALVDGMKSVQELQSTVKALHAQGNKKFGLDTDKPAAGTFKLVTVLRQLSPALDGNISKAEQLTGALGGGGLSGVAAPLGVSLGALFAVVAAGGAVLAKSVKDFEEYGSHIRDLQEETGGAAETLSTLDAGATLAGKSIDDLVPGIDVFMRKLAEAARDVDGPEAKMFQRFGINAKEAIKNPDEAIKLLLDTLGKYPNAAQRLEAANALAGKSGKALARVVEEMGGDFRRFQEEARAWGVVLSEEDVRAADKFGDALTVMGFKARGVLFGIARGALPELQKALDDTAGDVQAGGRSWEGFGRDAGKWIRETIKELKGLNDELNSVGDFLDDISGGINPLTRGRYKERHTPPAGANDPGRRFGGAVNSPGQVSSASDLPGYTPEPPEDDSARVARIAQQAAHASLRATQTAAETVFQQVVAQAQGMYRETGNLVSFIGAMKKAEAERWAARQAQFAAERDEIRARKQDEQLTLAELKVNETFEKQARAEFNLRMAELDRQRTDKSLAELQREHQEKLELYDLQSQEFVRRQQELADAGQISHRTAQQLINDETARGLEKRREFLEQEKEAAKDNAEAYAQVAQRLRVLTEEAQQFARHAGVAVTAATIKDLDETIDEAQKTLDRLEDLVVGIPARITLPDGPTVDPKDAGDAPSGKHLEQAAEWARTWKRAVGEVRGLFENFFLDLQGGFGYALRNMLAGFLQMIARMAAAAAAARIVKALFPEDSGGGNGGGGGGGGWLNTILNFGSKIASTLFAAGGAAEGGLITGPGTGTSDSILARLSNGEFVMRAAAVRNIGVDVLERMNSFSRTPAFALGGLVGSLPDVALPRGGDVYPVTVNAPINTPNHESFRGSEQEIKRRLARAAQEGVRRAQSRPKG